MNKVLNPFPYLRSYFLPVFFVLIALEAYLSYRHEKDLYNWQDSLSSIWVRVGAAVFNSLTKLYHITFFYELFKPLRMSWLGYERVSEILIMLQYTINQIPFFSLLSNPDPKKINSLPPVTLFSS